MGSKKGATNLSLLISTLLLLLVGLVSSDINQDKAECTDKLLALADCLPFVSGQAKAPALDCCTGIKQVVDKSKRCLCILIKDHDDPNLGFKINTTLALKLPSTCSSPTNITQCVDALTECRSLGLGPSVCWVTTMWVMVGGFALAVQYMDILHLAPKSPEAKIFEGFEKTLEKNSSTPVSSASGATGGGAGKGTTTSTGAQDKSGSGWGKNWLVAEVLCGILPLFLVFHFFFLVV